MSRGLRGRASEQKGLTPIVIVSASMEIVRAPPKRINRGTLPRLRVTDTKPHHLPLVLPPPRKAVAVPVLPQEIIAKILSDIGHTHPGQNWRTL